MVIARHRQANGRETTRRPFKAGARVRTPNVFFLPLAQTAVFFRLLLVCVPAGPSFSFSRLRGSRRRALSPAKRENTCLRRTYACFFRQTHAFWTITAPTPPEVWCCLEVCSLCSRGLGVCVPTWDCVAAIFFLLDYVLSQFSLRFHYVRTNYTKTSQRFHCEPSSNQGYTLKTSVRTEQSETRWNGREAF